jgi:hypothetical protein
MKFYIVLLILLFESAFGYCVGSVSDSNTVVSILTCAPGKEIYSIYGHNAVRIVNKNENSDLVFNYGTFDFKTPGFTLKFMRGKLPYHISVAPYPNFIYEYDYFKRSVTEQVLNLDSLEKQQIVQFLRWNMRPENKNYKYDFFQDNCATRLRDIIQKFAIHTQWDETKTSGKTFRTIIKEYQKDWPWLNFGVDLIIGSPADKVTSLHQQAFIPDYLATAIANASIKKQSVVPLTLSTVEVLSFDDDKMDVNFWYGPNVVFYLLLAFEIFLFFTVVPVRFRTWLRKYDQLWLSIILLSSVLMMFMWFFTDHIPTKNNWNLLWANPLIGIWWFLNGKNKKYTLALQGILYTLLIISMVNALPGAQFLPQFFHPVIFSIGTIIILKLMRMSKNERQIA